MKIKQVIPAYLKHLKVIGRSPRTVRNAGYDLNPFTRFLDAGNITTIDQLTCEVMGDYQQALAFSLTAKARPLTLRSQAQLLGTVKGFTRYLKEHGYLIGDPCQRLQLPKQPRRLPKVILNHDEVRKLLAAADLRTYQGQRDRLILELLYDTAVRRSEIKDIKLSDLDLASGYIRIIGKGDKERVVPVSNRVCGLIQNYLLFVRPEMVTGDDSGHLLVNRWGRQMHPNAVWAVVKRCAYLAGIKKRVSPHTFRHTCATHMLKNGAPIRHLQEMLGHESIESTTVYTHITINDLKRIHAQYHPGEQIAPKR
jgi:integrase/recombinase XerD